MKYLTLLLCLICLMSCSQNKKKYGDDQQAIETLKKLDERIMKQMQSPTDRYYWRQSPIIEALLKAGTTDRSIHYKLKDAYEKSQNMSEAEQDSVIKKFNLGKDSTD